MKKQKNASPYMEKYVLESLFKTGHGDFALERFKKRFGPMIEDQLHSTLYEGWEEGGFGGGSIKALRLNLSDLLCFSASRSHPADVLYQPKTTNLNEP